MPTSASEPAHPSLDRQAEYWNSTGAAKTFTHPLDLAWLSSLAPDARILDYGCGYGRVVGQLHEHGFVHAEGVDLSAALIDRAREAWPQLRFSVIDDPPTLPHQDDSFDAVLLFAVLTCIPGDEGQRRLVAELHRVLRPGGLIYLSDMCLQEDERNQARYRAFAAQYGTYGVFETGDGAVCRHHSPDWLRELLGGFDRAAEREVTVHTMNGHPASVSQILARKPASSSDYPASDPDQPASDAL